MSQQVHISTVLDLFYQTMLKDTNYHFYHEYMRWPISANTEYYHYSLIFANMSGQKNNVLSL